jgi:hypothetical protein
VREEGEPAQHDPGAEHAARAAEQNQLQQRVAEERQVQQIERRRHAEKRKRE